MKKSILIFLILGLIFTWACEKTIDIDIEATKPRLVINSIINPDSTISIVLSRSMHILDNQNILRVTNAKVTLFEDGVEIAQMQHKEKGRYVCNYYPKIGKKYSITASADGFDDVKASCDILPAVLISKLDTLVSYDEANNPFMKISLAFQDPPEKGNYYMVVSYICYSYEYLDYNQFIIDTLYQNQDTVIVDTTWGVYVKSEIRDIGYPTTEDMIAQNVSFGNISGLMLSDEVVNSQLYSLKFSLPIYSWVQVNELKYLIYFYTISKDFYLYLKTLSAHYDAVNDPFAEPIFVYSNVENGMGVLGSYTQRVDSIIIDPSRFDYHWYVE